MKYVKLTRAQYNKDWKDAYRYYRKRGYSNKKAFGLASGYNGYGNRTKR